MTPQSHSPGKIALRAVQVVAVAAVLFICTRSAGAHDLSISGIRIIYRPDDVLVCVSTHLSQLSKFEKTDFSRALAPDIDRAIRKRLHIRFNGRDFAPGKAYLIPDSANDQLSWQATADKTSSDYEVLSRLYPEDLGSVTIVSCVRDGQSVQEDLLNCEHPSLIKKVMLRSVMFRYLELGFKHILSGADHILFLLGLIILGGSFLSLMRIVTAFTLAHSVTLTLAVTGILVPSAKIIEPLIALSIVAIGIDNLLILKSSDGHLDNASGKARGDWRPLIAFAFGLVHGFGFAGGLNEIGLPAGALVLALVSFNLGVESGQATIVICMAPLIAFSKNKNPKFTSRFARVVSILISAIGLFWFVSRLSGHGS